MLKLPYHIVFRHVVDGLAYWWTQLRDTVTLACDSAGLTYLY